MSNEPKKTSPEFIFVLIVLVGLAVILEQAAYADSLGNEQRRETPQEVLKNKNIISQITYCRILALKIGKSSQALRYTNQLKKFDDFYNEIKIYYTANALGFLTGIMFQMGIKNPTSEQVKKVALQLYSGQCNFSF